MKFHKMSKYEPETKIRFLYVLKLENKSFYVGISDNLTQRFSDHFKGNGSEWTKQNKVINVINVIPVEHYWHENYITLLYMKKYGCDKVRGGSWTVVKKDYSYLKEKISKLDETKTIEENEIRSKDKDLTKPEETTNEEYKKTWLYHGITGNLYITQNKDEYPISWLIMKKSKESYGKLSFNEYKALIILTMKKYKNNKVKCDLLNDDQIDDLKKYLKSIKKTMGLNEISEMLKRYNTNTN